jgi:hypothetical protein
VVNHRPRVLSRVPPIAAVVLAAGPARADNVDPEARSTARKLGHLVPDRAVGLDAGIDPKFDSYDAGFFLAPAARAPARLTAGAIWAPIRAMRVAPSFVGLVFGGLFLVAPLSARAGDAGGDAGPTGDAKAVSSDARTSDEDAKASRDAKTPGDAKAPAEDATPDAPIVRSDAPTGCIAEGEPCTKSEHCCLAEAYCGSFGGVGASLVCGLNSSNSLSTGSCATTSHSSGEGLWFDGLSAVSVLAVTLAFVRRRARGSLKA